MSISKKFEQAEKALQNNHFDIHNPVHRTYLTEKLPWSEAYKSDDSSPIFRTTNSFGVMLEDRLERTPTLEDWKRFYLSKRE